MEGASVAVCDVCAFKARSEAGLASHVRQKHPPERPNSVLDQVVAELEGRSGPLVAAAVRLAGLIDDVSTAPRDITGLSRELRLVLEALDADTQETRSGLDELRARRASRRTAAEGSASAAGGE